MSGSRTIYARKLMKNFPDEPKRHRFWIRDCVAPRFLHQLKGEIARSIKNRDRRAFSLALEDVAIFAAYLTWPYRLALWCRAILSTYTATRFLIATGLAQRLRIA
jgi:hypothetical protein